MIKVHRGEAKYTSMTDLQWTSTETKSSQVLNNSPFHNFTADAYNHNQTIHDQNSQNHFFLCYITGNQTPKCTPPHPVKVYSYEGTFFFFFFFMAPAPGFLRKAPVEIQTNSHGSLNPAPVLGNHRVPQTRPVFRKARLCRHHTLDIIYDKNHHVCTLGTSYKISYWAIYFKTSVCQSYFLN